VLVFSSRHRMRLMYPIATGARVAAAIPITMVPAIVFHLTREHVALATVMLGELEVVPVLELHAARTVFVAPFASGY